MDAITILKAERVIYYAMMQTLQTNGVPRELWPLVVDSAAGRIKDESVTTLAMRADTSETEEDDGEHPAGD